MTCTATVSQSTPFYTPFPVAWLRPPPAPTRLTQASFATYLATCVPVDDLRYHYRHRGMWRRDPGEFTEERLQRAIFAHLKGRIHVATQWPAMTNSLEFDFDRKSPDTESWRSAYRRMDAVHRALGCPPVILWRSSSGADGWPGGVRMRIYLDQPVASETLRQAIEARLTACGIQLRPGRIEMWPDGAKSCRLPLGAGSDIIDWDGAPVTATWTRSGGLRRDLNRAIALWAQLSRQTTTLAALTGGQELGELILEEGGNGGLASPPVDTRDHGAGKSVLPGPLTGRGERNRVFGKLLCGWFTGAGMPREETLAIAERWVRRTDHVGDLAVDNPGRERVIASMLHSARRDLDRQEKKLQAGALITGRRGPGLGLGSRFPHPILSLSQVLVPLVAKSPNWREEVQGNLRPDDHARLAAIADPWLRDRVGWMMGIVRGLGPLTKVALEARALERIAGKTSPKRYRGTSPYKLMIRAAQDAGFLGDRELAGNTFSGSASVYLCP